MGACVMFDRIETMNHLNKKIPIFFDKAAALLSGDTSFVLILAAMYSSDTTFNFLVDTVIYRTGVFWLIEGYYLLILSYFDPNFRLYIYLLWKTFVFDAPYSTSKNVHISVFKAGEISLKSGLWKFGSGQRKLWVRTPPIYSKLT